MKHARPDYERFQDPDNLIPEDEPVFLLRGQDIMAPATLSHWANLVENSGGSADIVQLVREHAGLMRQWQRDHGSKMPDLPTIKNNNE